MVSQGRDINEEMQVDAEIGQEEIPHGDGKAGADGSGATQSPAVCSACGLERQNQHHLKKDGVVRLYCSSCVLFQHKGMYCCHCFHVYEDSRQLGDPAFWLTCSKCQRLTHIACAQKQSLPMDSFFFSCQYCLKEVEGQDGSPAPKRLRVSSPEKESYSLSDQETIAAAQIVAALAVQGAKEAKQKARACAAVAAKAAKLAKSALDVAYRARLDEVRWRQEAFKANLLPAPVSQTFKNMQIRSHIGDMKNQQTATHLDGKPGHESLMPLQQRALGTTFGNVLGNSEGSRAAATILSHHKRRVLPPVASPGMSGPPFAHSQQGSVVPKLQQQLPHQRASTQEELKGRGLQNEQSVVKVSDSPAVGSSPDSISESSTLLGITPRSGSSVSSVHAGIQRDAGQRSTYPTVHAKDSEGTSQVSGLKSSLAMVGHDTIHCSFMGVPNSNKISLAGELIRDAAEVVEIFPDDEMVDDFVYVRDLLVEGFEKERDPSSDLVELAGGPSVLSSLQDGSVGEQREDTTCLSGNDSVSVLQTNQLTGASDVATHSEPGSTMAVPILSGIPLVQENKLSEVLK